MQIASIVSGAYAAVAANVRGLSDKEIFELVASGWSSVPKEEAVAHNGHATTTAAKPARAPRKVGVKSVAKVAAAGKKARDGSGVAAVESFLKDRGGEWGVAKIIEGTGLARGAVNGALKALRGRGTVKDNGGGKRDMMYKYVGE